jgi:S1/P1 Nuclease
MTGVKGGALGGVLLVATLFAARPARAWDDFGHMEVAAVAYPALAAKTKARVAKLLALNPRYANWIVGAKRTTAERARAAFMRAATWADSIKSDPQYAAADAQTAPTAARNLGYTDLLRHAYWHFVDQPFSPDGTPLPTPPAPNAATEIPLLRAALADAATSDDVRSYDLVWLLHLVGDIHQPLHCVSRFDAADLAGDRGGNNVKLTGAAQPPVCDDPRYCPFGAPNELHAFFDDLAGSGYATAPPLAAAAKLAKPDKKAAAVSDVAVWIEEGLSIAQTKIYVAPIGTGDGPFAVTAAYQALADKLGAQRIALAGARLASLLNEALGK